VTACGAAADTVAVPADYTIPECSGETLLVPPAGELASLFRIYDPGGAAAVFDVPLRDVRRRARERIAGLAAAPAGAAAPRPDQPLVLMGHQPVFFHPGVWVKYFLLSKWCGVNGAAGLHCIVDTDAPGPITAAVPTGRDGVERATRTLVPLGDGVPLETAGVPSPEAWAAFAGAVRADLAALGIPDLAARFAAFADAEPEVRRGTATLAAYLDGLRRAYEARALAPRYADVSVSALTGTPEFREFALHLLQDPRGLAAAYNGCLDEYRRAHRVRSAANPFPNLGESGGRTEAPFWILHGGRRTDLYAVRNGGRLLLGSASATLATLPAGPAGADALASLNASGIALRPKAVTMTLFARLCLGDLFIHGVGGARYDRVTDGLAVRLFGVRPAPYAVATATLHLPLAGGDDPTAVRHTLEQRLMDLRHNPDRHLGAAGAAERGLVDEKWRLIREIETMRKGPQRRAAARRIREINGRLAEALAPEIARTEARLAELKGGPAATEVLEFRGYPFFLFDPHDVAALAPSPAGS
jgi:uncharacterized small protein (DUF1192 family)